MSSFKFLTCQRLEKIEKFFAYFVSKYKFLKNSVNISFIFVFSVSFIFYIFFFHFLSFYFLVLLFKKSCTCHLIICRCLPRRGTISRTTPRTWWRACCAWTRRIGTRRAGVSSIRGSAAGSATSPSTGSISRRRWRRCASLIKGENFGYVLLVTQPVASPARVLLNSLVSAGGIREDAPKAGQLNFSSELWKTTLFHSIIPKSGVRNWEYKANENFTLLENNWRI